MSFRKYLVLAVVTVFGAVGDCLLARGMKDVGGISPQHLTQVVLAVLNPWVALGILFLLGFFAAYMHALSWADLTYVLPATSLGYVVLALIARFSLHEQISPARWFGIVLISTGVALATRGPELTHNPPPTESDEYAAEPVSTRSE